MKKIIYILLVILVVGLVWFLRSNRAEIISADTLIRGDYAIEKGKKIALANGATLTVEGNLNLAGELSCEKDSGIRLQVKGDTTVDGKIRCENENGVTIIANENFMLGSESELTSGGNLQIVEREELLAVDQARIDQLYEEAAKDAGAGQRIGPFISEGSGETSLKSFVPELVEGQNQNLSFGLSQEINFGRLLVKKVQAASHTVVIGGKISVPTPPPGVKRIVVLNFPTAVGVEIKDFELSGPDGRPGADDKGNSCNAKGKDGEDAFRFLAYAGNMTVNNFTLKLGSGGKGGDAQTTKDCDPGIATGGSGGKSGNFKMIAANEFKITGAFIVEPGKGGEGGSAIAYGKDGGPSQKGGDATATGGRGADNNKKLGIEGTVAGTENVQIGSVIGGKGGDATANPGNGGDGIGCNSKGGEGGKGTATGGRGGKASLSLAGAATRTPGAQDIGGDGGSADSYGGKGGDGGDCGPEGPGGPGGKGGDATSNPGKGGIGANKNGTDGEKKNETGGNGGNGGDGCPEGPGGNGGKGNPPGKDGLPGKNLCAKQGSQTTPDQPSDIDIQPSPTPTPSGEKIPAILYNGKYIPVQNQLHAEPGHETDPSRSCPEEHWHSFEGIVITTDKTQIVEPSDPCGFGTTKQRPVVQIEI